MPLTDLTISIAAQQIRHSRGPRGEGDDDGEMVGDDMEEGEIEVEEDGIEFR